MTTYRLDRRFVLVAVGLNVIAAGVMAALAYLWWWPFGVVAALLLLNALVIYAVPPVVARTDPAGVRLGGRLTVKPVQLGWSAVEDVTVDAQRVYLDRGGDSVLAFPLVYVGPRGPELVRDLHDRLNTANGYRRYDPS